MSEQYSDIHTESVNISTAPRQIEKPLITPTLVIGLGGTGTDAVRFLKRRLVWLWHHEEIEKALHQKPIMEDSRVWERKVWHRFEMEGSIPLIQLLAVDTWPWSNRAGQVYLNEHEYAYIGGYNATRVLDTISRHREDPEKYPDNHPEIAEWWHWYEHKSRPGQIHSGARQIRPIGRLSFYRRYRSFWAKLKPQIDKISSIQAKQEVEDRDYQVSPAAATRRLYIITSICGGTGAGIFLDVAACLRHYFLESAIISGILALPSVFIPDLQSDLQKERVRANAYAALKEVNNFQRNEFNLWLPGENPVKVSNLFNRVYLVERENLAQESLNSIEDVKKLIANQIFLEGMTDVGSQIWEYDVNVTMERKQTNGRETAYIFSSFANSTLGVPRDDMVEYTYLRYTEALVRKVFSGEIDREGILKAHLTADQKNALNLEVGHTFNRLTQMIEGLGEEEESEEEEEEEAIGLTTAVIPTSGEKLRVTAPLEQFCMDVNAILQNNGFSGGQYYLERMIERLNSQVKEDQQESANRVQDVEHAERDLQTAQARNPWYMALNFPPFNLLVGSAVRRQQTRLRRLHENRDEAIASRDTANSILKQWTSLQANILPLKEDLIDRSRMVLNLWQKVRSEMNRLFSLTRTTEQSPFEMFTQVLGKEYIEEVLYPEVLTAGLRQQLVLDAKRLLNDDAVCLVEEQTAEHAAAGTDAYNKILRFHPTDQVKMLAIIKGVAFASAQQYLKPNQFHIHTILNSNNVLIQTRLRDLFSRCQPFWRYNLDKGGLSETDMERSILAGVHDKDNRDWNYLLRDFQFFKLVETNDPTRIDAAVLEHGLPIQYLESLEDMKNKYDKFFESNMGPLQLNKHWEPDGEDPLEELIGEPPKRKADDRYQQEDHKEDELDYETDDEEGTTGIHGEDNDSDNLF